MRSSSAARTAHFCAISDSTAASSGVAAAAASLAQRWALSRQSAELAGMRPPLSETGLTFVRQAFSAAGQTRWFAHRRGFPLAYKPRLGGFVPKARHSANAAHISPITAAMPIHGSKYLMRLGLFRSFCILILILDERY